MAEQAANTTPRAEGRRPRNPRGGRRDDRRNVRDDAPKEFEELVINIDRVSRVVKGGRRFRFKALVVVGNRKDKVGVGVAKGADVQAAVAKAKESKGELTEDDVRKIVEDTLKNYKLDQVVTGNQVNVIINFAFNLSKSDILNNEDFTKTLKDLKQSIVAQAGDSFSNIDLNFDANKAIQDGGNILSSIWQTILDFFKSFGA